MQNQPTDLPGIFRRAAETIDHNGLYCGGFFAPLVVPDPRGELHPHDVCLRPVDMVGAIRIACGLNPELDSLLSLRALDFASAHMPDEASKGPLSTGSVDPVENIADWNDHSNRTAADVIVCLKVLAIQAEALALTAQVQR
jgi:hypothetical protein